MSEVKLCETMDAKVWTDEFLSLNPDAKDFGTMIGWFANAIMVGYDHATWKLQPALDQAQDEIADFKKIRDRLEQETLEQADEIARLKEFEWKYKQLIIDVAKAAALKGQ